MTRDLRRLVMTEPSEEDIDGRAVPWHRRPCVASVMPSCPYPRVRGTTLCQAHRAQRTRARRSGREWVPKVISDQASQRERARRRTACISSSAAQ